MLRLFTEQEANERAFQALTRFLDLLDELEPRSPAASRRSTRSSLSFQLKLLWLSGYLPHLDELRRVRGRDRSPASRRRPGGAVCGDCANGAAMPLSREGLLGIEGLLRAPARRGAASRPDRRAARARRSRDHCLVRVPRRLPPAHARPTALSAPMGPR